MQSTTIGGTKIDHKGDVDNGLTYLRNNWSDSYVLDAFENARTSRDRQATFRSDKYAGSGMYVLKYINERHYSLEWRD
jgi:hypothetical protein